MVEAAALWRCVCLMAAPASARGCSRGRGRTRPQAAMLWSSGQRAGTENVLFDIPGESRSEARADEAGGFVRHLRDGRGRGSAVLPGA